MRNSVIQNLEIRDDILKQVRKAESNQNKNRISIKIIKEKKLITLLIVFTT